MALVKHFKVIALPSTPEADSIYYVKGASDTAFRFYVTNSSGAVVEIDAVTMAQLTAALAGKEDVLPMGTTAQYFRGNKTLATLNKAAVGLGNVDNTSDMAKPVSTAQQTALDGKINITEKGAANGVATLGADSKIPANQLPSFVDDVLEFADRDAFPTTGEVGKIYIALDTNLTWRWSGSTYVKISSGDVTELSNFFVRYDTTQSLNSTQQGNARGNIGAAADTAVVKLSGNQSIAGIKTHSSAPRSSVDASSGNDLVRLSQVTTMVAGAELHWSETGW